MGRVLVSKDIHEHKFFMRMSTYSEKTVRNFGDETYQNIFISYLQCTKDIARRVANDRTTFKAAVAFSEESGVSSVSPDKATPVGASTPWIVPAAPTCPGDEAEGDVRGLGDQPLMQNVIFNLPPRTALWQRVPK